MWLQVRNRRLRSGKLVFFERTDAPAVVCLTSPNKSLFCKEVYFPANPYILYINKATRPGGAERKSAM